MRASARGLDETKPAIGLTMFGVTTPCVQAVAQRAGGRVRLPRLPRHRHRRPVDGEARRLRPARRRRSTSPPPRSATSSWAASSRRRGPASAPSSAPRAALCRLLRRARHGQFRAAGDGARALQGPQSLPPQPERDADADDAGGECARSASGSRASSTGCDGPVRFLHSRRRRLRDRRSPAAPFYDPEADAALFEALAATVRAGPRPPADPAAAAHQRPGLRRRRWRRISVADRRREEHSTCPDRAQDAARASSTPWSRERPADHRRRRRHRPLGQVRGGRRHRPDRHLQFRPLPHGRPRLAGRPARLRQRQRDRHGDGARGAAGGASTRRCWPASTAPIRSCC